MAQPDKKLLVDLGVDTWHGYQTESVWVESMGAGRFKIRNVPFFAKGLGLDDIVIARVNDHLLELESVIFQSGHSTYRIIKLCESSADFERYWRPLATLGCTYESSTSLLAKELFAVDVPPTADIHQVYQFLQAGEQGGVWEFEEGHCAQGTVTQA